MGTNERLSSAHTKREEEEEEKHFCELDGLARIASSKGERFEPRENAEHTRRLEETREVSRPKNQSSHPSSRHSKRRRHHQCAIESTYNNRNRKRLLKNGVETNHERACGLAKRSANLVLGWPAVGGRHIPLGRDHHRPSRKSLPRRLVLRRDPLPSRLPV